MHLKKLIYPLNSLITLEWGGECALSISLAAINYEMLILFNTAKLISNQKKLHACLIVSVISQPMQTQVRRLAGDVA